MDKSNRTTRAAVQNIFDWDLTLSDKVDPEHRLQAAAVVSRSLHYIALGIRASGNAQDDCDDALVEAHAGYLKNLLTPWLPREATA